jgi:peptide/nickel transport system substrate-binding protein
MEIRLAALKGLVLLIVVSLGASAIPAIMVGVAPAENASAQVGGGHVRVGWIQDFQNWNPLTIEMVSDWVATYLIYSSLFQYDEDWEAIENHLATGYYQEVDEGAGNMSTWINITDTAYFRNAANPEDKSHPVTAEDVEFTIELIKDNPGGSWDYYVYNISDVYVINDHQVKIDTEYPKATLIDDLVWIPILPKYIWQDVSESKILSNMKPSDLIGSGPFYFDSMSLGQWYKFDTAPNFHGAADYADERDIDFEGIIYTVYTDLQPLALAIERAEEDVIDITGVQGTVWDDLGAGMSEIVKQVTVELGIYDVAINAIPLEMRTQQYGNGNVILLDDVVRKALGMTMNRESLVNDYFDGRPIAADTVLNPGFWHANLSDFTEVIPYNPAWAAENLTAAGYVLNDDDIFEVTEECDAYLLYGADLGDPLQFRLRVPDSDPGYAAVGEAWVSWAAQAGIQLDFSIEPEGVMVAQDWYKADYDIWVWSWYWGPEPLSNLACWLTREVVQGGYNCVGPICSGGLDEPDGWWWENEETREARCDFDAVFEEAMRTPDRDERKILVDELQVRIYDTWAEFPPVHPNGLYAMSTAHYDGWGDWETHLARTIISDMLWVWYDLYPVSDNDDPVFDTPPVNTEVEINREATFTIGVSDSEGDPITVNWSFGDGSDFEYSSVTGDTTTEQIVTQTHTYSQAGTYTLRVGIKDDQHEYERAESATVTVVLEMNLGPEFGSVYADPPMAYVGEEVTWTAPAKDAEQGVDGAGLLFTWDWGDDTPLVSELIQPVENETFVSSVQTHAWEETGSYYVTVSVWDGFDVETNEIHNVTYVESFEVISNTAPSAPEISAIDGIEDVEIPCVAVASDPDPDVLTFTWEWDDGTYTVTTHDTSTAPGVPVTSVVGHIWDASGTYPVTVYVDDGEVDHNVSSTIDAVILATGEEAPPGSISLTVTPYPPYIDEELTLNVSAYDANGDALTVTIEFGDDDVEVQTTVGGEGLQYVEFTHTYTSEDVYSVVVHVDDGTTNVTTTFELSVTLPIANRAPTISLQSSYSFYLGVDKLIRPLKVSDPDGDELSVWYDWGDDTPLAEGDPEDGFAANHTYIEAGTFTLTVWADDGVEFNVSAEASVNVQEANRKPTIEPIVKTPSKDEYEIDELIVFSVMVKDKEGDLVNITIVYGDGSQDSIEISDLAPDTNRTVQFEHAYSEADDDPYEVVITVKDDQLHTDMTWNTRKTTVEVTEETGGLSMALIAGIAIAILVAIAVVVMLMKRKKKGQAAESGAGMEGMAPPEPQATPPAEPPPS